MRPHAQPEIHLTNVTPDPFSEEPASVSAPLARSEEVVAEVASISYADGGSAGGKKKRSFAALIGIQRVEQDEESEGFSLQLPGEPKRAKRRRHGSKKRSGSRLRLPGVPDDPFAIELEGGAEIVASPALSGATERRLRADAMALPPVEPVPVTPVPEEPRLAPEVAPVAPDYTQAEDAEIEEAEELITELDTEEELDAWPEDVELPLDAWPAETLIEEPVLEETLLDADTPAGRSRFTLRRPAKKEKVLEEKVLEEKVLEETVLEETVLEETVLEADTTRTGKSRFALRRPARKQPLVVSTPTVAESPRGRFTLPQLPSFGSLSDSLAAVKTKFAGDNLLPALILGVALLLLLAMIAFAFGTGSPGPARTGVSSTPAAPIFPVPVPTTPVPTTPVPTTPVPTTPVPTTPAPTTPAPTTPTLPTKAVPSLKGLTLDIATEQLRAAGFTAVISRKSALAPKDVVLSQQPAGGSKLAGGAVTLVVSTGPVLVSVPLLQGLSIAEATASLARAGLRLKRVDVGDDAAIGRVLEQSPRAGNQVAKGSTVTLNVSMGQPQMNVPAVRGMQMLKAQQKLARAGFNIKVSFIFSKQAVGTVIAQAPKASTKAELGATIRINVSKGERPQGPTTTQPAESAPSSSGPVAAPTPDDTP